MISEELKFRARAGDLQALQQLRDRGFFSAKKAAEGYPVSYAQRRLWLVDKMVDGFGAYNIPVRLRLDGKLDSGALREALGLLIGRHESLRTTFASVGGDLRQFVSDGIETPWSETDLSADSDAEVRVREMAQEEENRPFDLWRGPLLRAALIRLAPDRHVFLLNIHHIVSDLASVRILLQELAIGYEALASGHVPALPPLPMQFKDFASWQNTMLAGPDAARHRSYWFKQLAAPLAPLDLPADFPRPALKSYRGKVVRALVDVPLTQQLRTLGLQRGLTLFMVLAASLEVLLHRYTRQGDIIVGFPVSGRDHPGVADQIGCFVGVLALRNHLDANDSFLTVLGNVRQAMLDAYEHQTYPLDKLVEELALPRDMSRVPVVDVLLNLAYSDRKAMRVGSLMASPWEDEYAAAKADLSFDFFETDQGLDLAVTYSADIFVEQRVRRMAEHLVTLMRNAVQEPTVPIGRIVLMFPQEQHRILVEFNETSRPYDPQTTLVDLFEHHVQRTPHAAAVRCGGQEISYEKLNRTANRVARELIQNGVGTETLVGVFMEPSLELVTAFLACLKASGVYVPFDPTNPIERLAGMLDDASMPVILTQAHLKQHIPAATQSVILLGDALAQDSADDDMNPVRTVDPDNAAYAIFTSGSTGRPKAAVLIHRGLSNMIAEQAHLFAPRNGDRVLQFAAPGFDASVFEFALALAHGATLCLAHRDDLMPGRALLSTLQREEISITVLPPSTLAAMPFAELPKLRVLNVGGEVCTAELVRQWAPGRAFFNLYGPTETTIFAAGALCEPDARHPPIGRPIGNTRIYLLDESLQPVPLGVVGELCIAGDSLARHYLNQPELTRARFVRNPFDRTPEARLYRTGDLARYRPDGAIEFLRRIDTQVKLRGYRIELSEIEAQLARHPSICEAVALVRDIGTGPSLAAYAAIRQNSAEIGVEEIRNFLRSRLPDYMVPAYFALLEELPKTPNKKIDRKALAELAFAQPDQAALFVAPRNEVEQVLAGLFSDVLKAEPVGGHSNFFELGGDSLLATRIVSRIQEIFHVEVPIPEFFRAGTVAAVAEILKVKAPAGRAEMIASALRRVQRMSPEQKKALLDRQSAR